MKRICALLIALVCIFTLTASAYAANPDPYTLYSSAVEKMGKVTSFQVDNLIKMKFSYGSTSSSTMSMTMEVKYTTKLRITDDGKLEMSMVMKDNELGMDMEAYYKNGYYYMSSGNRKVRYKMSEAVALSQSGATGFGAMKAWFEDAAIEQLDTGKRIKYAIPSKQIDSIMDTAMGALTSDGTGGNSYRFSKVNCYTTVADNGYIRSHQMSFTMADKNDTSTKVGYTFFKQYSRLNNVSSISFPTDLSTYKTIAA
ncbi:hypothetical protein LJC63_12450 [Ruminococcaceae bacterium OttesenSCG-928-L11]|nr:hypothetical protein [Ruminococcaceae bacterium OttesenSCG-928-L11]